MSLKFLGCVVCLTAVAAASGLPEFSDQGTISVSQLRQHIPQKALQEFSRAQKACASGNAQESIRHLERAISIEPGFSDAYNNLGAHHLRLYKFDQAVAELSKATELDNTSAVAFSNLGIGLYGLNRMSEAEKAARTAVRLDHSNLRSRLVLGLALLALDGTSAEAVKNLEAAAREIPRARLPLAHALEGQGRREAAIREINSYLHSGESGGPMSPAELESWMARLRQDTPPQVSDAKMH